MACIWYSVPTRKKRGVCNMSDKPKKPIFKKWWFWVIVVLVVGAIGAAAGGNDDTPSAASQPPRPPRQRPPRPPPRRRNRRSRQISSMLATRWRREACASPIRSVTGIGGATTNTWGRLTGTGWSGSILCLKMSGIPTSTAAAGTLTATRTAWPAIGSYGPPTTACPSPAYPRAESSRAMCALRCRKARRRWSWSMRRPSGPRTR